MVGKPPFTMVPGDPSPKGGEKVTPWLAKPGRRPPVCLAKPGKPKDLGNTVYSCKLDFVFNFDGIWSHLTLS
ncbi:unnamed protein product [Orchesella dallaii]|uniref:Uncharacterized protein n=1 Tax=Orchesella dallaii TaxID=48710 RepID=A0ABP1QBH5_9HEXA